MLQQSPCSVVTRSQPRMLAVRGHEPMRLARADQGPRRSKTAQLISPEEQRGADTIRTYRRDNVREAFPTLASLVEEISDWDFPDPDMARALAIKVLPSTTLYFIVQYRDATRSWRKFLDTNCRHKGYYSIITKADTGIITVRPPGPLGVIIVKLKPEATSSLFAEPLRFFSDTKIDLDEVFDSQEVRRLEEAVSEAPSSAERVATVARFLCAHMRPHEADPTICRAAACLRRDPSMRVRRLALDLDVSERQLLRRFRSVLGLNPKQFARCARIEKVMAARAHGSAWADIAYGCGFADQAHMINEFNAVLGAPPERALLPPSAEQDLATDANKGVPITREYFF